MDSACSVPASNAIATTKNQPIEFVPVKDAIATAGFSRFGSQRCDRHCGIQPVRFPAMRSPLP
ncbi:hypothetical protein [Laspinema olomoucense]|uniref:hypothetical protein n=1 Tax=Laspinema olomoucense TaxID=3231600 RepID=UPI0021BB1918|nr:hypothetical protein [Laspinema sp. D3c]MCT7992461.1 hypothetical protein [Laspinema sp. D3c]